MHVAKSIDLTEMSSPSRSVELRVVSVQNIGRSVHKMMNGRALHFIRILMEIGARLTA